MQNVHFKLFSRLLLVSLMLVSQAFSTNAYAENPQIKLDGYGRYSARALPRASSSIRG